MGIYLNPGNEGFQRAVNSEIYIDKSELIAYTNKVLHTEQQFICVSRPRRFGKSIAANMLAAYYDRSCDSKGQFDSLKIARSADYDKFRNKYNVIFLNMQDFFGRTQDTVELKKLLERSVVRDILRAYPDCDYLDRENLISVLQDVYEESAVPFVIIIDEWDCVFRENRHDKEAQRLYLDYLRNLLKDRKYIALVYMTGILPVKKYGSHSALNMFDEFSMTSPRQLAEYVGFTETEVQNLCAEYHMSFEETRRWYDGYQFDKNLHIYSPRSVVSAMLSHQFENYWTKTETYEALKVYIEMNYDGLKDTIVELLAGARKEIDTGTFTNDMTTFQSKDDVLTLLVHLGYLAFDVVTQEVFIPNYEVSGEFVNAMKGAGWDEVVNSVKASKELLEATWRMDADAVEKALEKYHMETSVLTYNNENALSYTISIAYYSARTYYTIIRELPAGKGFADLVFIPRKNHTDKPAMVIELKWNKTVQGALGQIKNNCYPDQLKEYQGNILLVGINYDKKSKKHTCIIEREISQEVLH